MPHLIFEGFTASFQIALNRCFHPEFGRDLSKVFAYHAAERKLKNMDAFWKTWPFSVTTFGMYLRSARSALGVASRFLDSVHTTAMITRVEEFKTFDSDDFGSEELERWARLIAAQLDNSFSFSIWPKGIMHRDYEVLVSKVNEEIAKHGQTTNRTPKSTDEWVTITMLHNITKNCLMLDGTECVVSRKTISRLAKKWTPRDSTRRRNREYLWSEARASLYDALKISIGDQHWQRKGH